MDKHKVPGKTKLVFVSSKSKEDDQDDRNIDRDYNSDTVRLNWSDVNLLPHQNVDGKLSVTWDLIC